MPNSILALLLLIAGSALFGAMLGWALRGVRSKQRKNALNAEWREQIEAVKQSESRLNTQRKKLNNELVEMRMALIRAEQAASGADAHPTGYERNPAALTAELTETQAKLARSQAKRRELQNELKGFIKKIKTYTAASKEKDDKIFALSRELESWEKQVPPLVDRFREQQDEHTSIVEKLAAERKLNETLSESLKIISSPPELEAAVEQAVDDALASERLNGSAAQAVPIDSAQHGSAEKGVSPPEHDDLKLIRGIGPSTERTLHTLGIYRLTQIASLGDNDIERIAAQLPQFPGRIQRDRWIEQARELTGTGAVPD